MTDFAVHSVAGSPYGRAVLATLVEKGASYRFAPVAPGGNRQEPHVSRHPFGRVPVLEHDGYMLYETQAILRYLDRVLPDPALTPADPKAAGRMDQVMNICDWYLFQGVNNVIGFHRVVRPRLMGLAPDEAAIAEAMPKAPPILATAPPILPSPNSPSVRPRRSPPIVCCQPPDRNETASRTRWRWLARISAQVISIVGVEA